MKCWILLIIVLLLPSVFADNEYGKQTSGNFLLITDVDVKVGEKTSRNLEYGETITKEANPDMDLQFTIEVKNNNSDLEMTDVEMTITIDDLDLDEATDEIELQTKQDKNMVLNMVVPSDADEDTYRVFIEIKSEWNSTIQKVEYILDLEVVEPEEDKVDEDTLRDIIASLNQTIIEQGKLTNSYFEPYTECTSELSTCNTDKEGKDNEINNLKDFETKFNDCETKREQARKDINELERKVLTTNQTISSCQVDLKKAKDSTKWWVIGIIFAGGILFWQYNKRRNPDREVDMEGK